MSNNDRAHKNVVVGSGVRDDAIRPAGWRIPYRLIEPAAIALDAAVIMVAYAAAKSIYSWLAAANPDSDFAIGAVVVAVLFVGLAKFRQLYKPSKLLVSRTQIRNTILLWLSTLFFFAAVVFAWKVGDQVSRGLSIIFAITGVIVLCATRVFWRLFIARGLSDNRFIGRAAIFIGDPALAAEPDFHLQMMKYGYSLDRQFLLPDVKREALRCAEIISQAMNYVRGSNVREIFVGIDLLNWTELKPVLLTLRGLPVPVRLLPFGGSLELFSLPVSKIGNAPSLEFQREPLRATERLVKRAFDLTVATGFLVLLFPLLVLIAIAIKVDSRGPVLFRQRRCGFNGQQFRIFKFRTMSVLEDGPSIVPASRHDHRVTRVGKWLRRTSVDELPQLLNVLMGTMSIVGPRPHAVAHDDEFQSVVQNYAYRHHVKPGITGWAQVNSQRGQITTSDELERRLELDIWYINNWSLTLDLWIVLRTAFEILRGENAY